MPPHPARNSLGLSLTGLVFAAVAGSRAAPPLVGRGFTAACLFLAGIAVLAAVVAAARTELPATARIPA